MDETVTITGTQLGFISFIVMIFIHAFAWSMMFRQLRRHRKAEKKREELRETQMRRDDLCSAMINYKKDTGYSFKKEDVTEYQRLVLEEDKLLKELMEIE